MSTTSSSPAKPRTIRWSKAALENEFVASHLAPRRLLARRHRARIHGRFVRQYRFHPRTGRTLAVRQLQSVALRPRSSHHPQNRPLPWLRHPRISLASRFHTLTGSHQSSKMRSLGHHLHLCRRITGRVAPEFFSRSHRHVPRRPSRHQRRSRLDLTRNAHLRSTPAATRRLTRLASDLNGRTPRTHQQHHSRYQRQRRARRERHPRTEVCPQLPGKHACQ